jgi:hypothetical protein
MGTNCPCRGTLTIVVDNNGDLRGSWKTNGPGATLSGSVGYNQDVWTGRFAQPDDADFPIRGHFRLESRGEAQPDGLLSARRHGHSVQLERHTAVGVDLTRMPVASISGRMDRLFFPAPTTLTTVRT